MRSRPTSFTKAPPSAQDVRRWLEHLGPTRPFIKEERDDEAYAQASEFEIDKQVHPAFDGSTSDARDGVRCQGGQNRGDRYAHHESGEQPGCDPHWGKQKPRRNAPSPVMSKGERKADTDHVHRCSDRVQHHRTGVLHHAAIGYAQRTAANPDNFESEIWQGARDCYACGNQPGSAQSGGLVDHPPGPSTTAIVLKGASIGRPGWQRLVTEENAARSGCGRSCTPDGLRPRIDGASMMLHVIDVCSVQRTYDGHCE
jgi:hypothetical protein